MSRDSLIVIIGSLLFITGICLMAILLMDVQLKSENFHGTFEFSYGLNNFCAENGYSDWHIYNSYSGYCFSRTTNEKRYVGRTNKLNGWVWETR